MELGSYLSQMDPAQIPGLELTLTIQPPIPAEFPECLPRQHLPGYLHLIGARVGVEVGVQRGEFSEHLLEHWGGKLFMVDAWRYQPAGYRDAANVSDAEHQANYLEAKAVERKFANRAVIMRGLSVEMSRRFADEALDFVYLDANHSCEAVTADLEAWFPKVRPGGLIAGHDFIDADNEYGSFRVRSAVLNFAPTRPVFVSREHWPSLWFFKK
jgi:hypothetical protein